MPRVMKESDYADPLTVYTRSDLEEIVEHFTDQCPVCFGRGGWSGENLDGTPQDADCEFCYAGRVKKGWKPPQDVHPVLPGQMTVQDMIPSER